jgi:RNA polymerase sigma-70 factor (ECF subfamily)
MTREKLNDLVREMSRRLYSIAFRMLMNKEEAEDAVQEIFIKLWNMGEQLDKYRSPGALATTMIKNHCIDLLRKRRNTGISSDEKEIPGLFSESPQDLIENRESGEIMENLIEKLPEMYRKIVILKEIEGLDYNEIAEQTNQNINTLRVNLSRARVILRDEYRKYYNEHRGIKQAAGKIL